MGQEQHAWAAGIIDADGCITIKRRRQGGATYYALFVVIGQVGDGDTPPLVLAKLQDLYGGSIEWADRPGRRRMWHLPVSTANAEAMLRRIRPYLVGKANQADIALEYRERALGRGKGAAAEEYYWRLRETKNYTEKEQPDHEQRTEAEAGIRRRQARARKAADEAARREGPSGM